MRVEQAHLDYGERRVLGGINLELRRGEIYGLLGQNGAGKTTLMKAICGRLRLSSGRVLVENRNPCVDRRVQRRIGFVPQDIALYPYLTVLENLQVFGRLAGVPRRTLSNVIGKVILQAGLSDRAEQLCRTLSGGYQRRVNLCASILHSPALLVLDEPTVGIDIDARDAIHRMLEALRASGTAILLSTHDLDQAQLLSDRVGILHGGKLVVEGTPSGLLRHVFDTQQEIVVTFGTVPNANAALALRRLGLAPTPRPSVWIGRVGLAHLDAGRLGRQLADFGIGFKELRIREPDLNSLFLLAVSNAEAP